MLCGAGNCYGSGARWKEYGAGGEIFGHSNEPGSQRSGTVLHGYCPAVTISFVQRLIIARGKMETAPYPQSLWGRRKKSPPSGSGDGDTWSQYWSIKSHHDLPASRSESLLRAPQLPVIHPLDVAFSNDVDYRTYHLHIESLRYNGKMAACTAKLAKRMEKITYLLDSIKTIRWWYCHFLGQFKKVCDSHVLSESVARWLLLFFMGKSPAASLTIRLILRKNIDAPAIVRQGIGRQERMCTDVKAVGYLVYSYATNDVITKAASKMESLMRFPN